MIELSKHIEILLLKHNCVIVPQLGGFIAQDVPARFIPEENLFLPPHRTVGFNPQLTLNDGLLVQSYMQEYDTNYPETVKLIEQEVTALNNELQQKGEYELSGIGKLTLNIDGVYNFTPNEAGILSPDLYGLDAVSVKLRDKNTETNTADSEIQTLPKSHHSSRNYTFSINRELVNYVAAAAVAIFFYFVWATPITDNAELTPHQASLLFPHTIQHVTKSIPDFTPVECDSLEEANGANTAAANTIADEGSNKEELSNDYTIVLVSCIPMKNAERFIQELKDKGIDNVSILNKRNIIRVVYGAYSSEENAYNDLVKLRKLDKTFSEAWILHNK